MKVKIKKTDELAKMPFKTYEEDFCYDCVAISCTRLGPNIYRYGLGLAFEIVRDDARIPADAHLSVDFRPRSSIFRTGMILSNCIGTVDELYRGEASAIFYHVIPDLPKYEIGQKIVQCKLGITLPMEFEWADELTETTRGTKGYGSTDNRGAKKSVYTIKDGRITFSDYLEGRLKVLHGGTIGTDRKNGAMRDLLAFLDEHYSELKNKPGQDIVDFIAMAGRVDIWSVTTELLYAYRGACDYYNVDCESVRKDSKLFAKYKKPLEL